MKIGVAFTKSSAAELVRGLDETWAFIEARLQRWTPADCAKTFSDEWDGQVHEVLRSWVLATEYRQICCVG